jgi:hypothetical protein
MNIATHLIRKGASRIIADREVKRIRREHDEFIRTAKLGTTYYTLKPATTYDPLTNRPVHIAYTFVRQGRGLLTGQLIADGHGTPSWDIWYNNGPLTAQRMPTAADYRAEDDRAFAAFNGRAQQKIAADAMAEIQRLYPASAEHLLAAA